MYAKAAPYTGGDYPLLQQAGLGDLWSTVRQVADTVARVTGKVNTVAQQVNAAVPYAQDVAQGRSQVVVVPKAAPAWLIPVGLGLVGYMLIRSSRR